MRSSCHGFYDGSVEEILTQWRYKQSPNRCASRGLSKDRHIVWVATKRLNIIANPLKGFDLVVQSKVGFFQLGMHKVTKGTQPVIESHQDQVTVSLVHQDVWRIRVAIAVSTIKPASIYPNHDSGI